MLVDPFGDMGSWVWAVVEGPHVGIYRNYKEFERKRDEKFRVDKNGEMTGYSWKGCRFWNEAEAIEYFQAQDHYAMVGRMNHG